MQIRAPEWHVFSTALYLLCLHFCSLHLPLEGGSTVWHYVPLTATVLMCWHGSIVVLWHGGTAAWWRGGMTAQCQGQCEKCCCSWSTAMVTVAAGGAEPVWPNCVAFRFESSPNSELLHLWLWELSNLTFNFTKMCLYFECPLGTFTKRPVTAEPCDTHPMPGCLKGCIHSPLLDLLLSALKLRGFTACPYKVKFNSSVQQKGKVVHRPDKLPAWGQSMAGEQQHATETCLTHLDKPNSSSWEEGSSGCLQ